ncbi:polyketide cyclase [Halomicrobium mukohataei]|uniref:Polyketide cyclase n=1 Tax=Halomicrobium mukohataei TaxID=57705 RepID=A0A847UHR1_9EURY|nr:SRPBCC family protein [Halomicrobium mukohataei]NLV10638.1 polyketide cyclase [Halomicrobium mukohataei]
MTVRVERTMTVPASPERVWEFIADPDRRAAPISVIERWETHDDGSATWHLALPIPLIDSTVAVETSDDERRAPDYVSFTGRSKVMSVRGEHELEAIDRDDGSVATRLTNRFVVDGRIPGVERFFKRNFDAELENLERALLADIEDRP